MHDAAYFRTQATKAHRLARSSNEREAKILSDLAAEYEAKARELEQDQP